MAKRWGNSGNSLILYFWVAPKSLQMVIAAMKLKNSYSLEGSYDQPRQHIKKQRHYFANKGPSGQGYDFSSGHVWMWELECEESWVPKNWWFWTVVLEKTLESPLDCKEIQPVHPEGDQSWVFIGRTDAEVKLQYFGHIMGRVDSLEKTLMLGGIEGRRRRGRQRMRWLDGITDWWAWILVNSGSLWCTGRPGVLWSMGLQRVGHDWATELNWTEQGVSQGITRFNYEPLICSQPHLQGCDMSSLSIG